MSRIISLNEVRQREGKRFQSKDHLGFVAEQPCSVCGYRPVHVHHLLHFTGGTKRGTGKRAGDQFTVALCPDHHREAHKAPASFEVKYGLASTAAHLWEVSPANKKGDTPEGKTDAPPS